jgi:hypothetical protein
LILLPDFPNCHQAGSGKSHWLKFSVVRHRFIFSYLSEERFVPNDTGLASMGRANPPVGPDALQRVPTETERGSPEPQRAGNGESAAAGDSRAPQIALITGPNMAGKRTYIRQVALLTLLAHTGSFVPAAEARIDLVDRIFTRIGASDDLARGQSTFMVEMTETANILNNATSRSLIVLDEIGRGTATFDGLSIAWAVAEYLPPPHPSLDGLRIGMPKEYTQVQGLDPEVKNAVDAAVRTYQSLGAEIRYLMQMDQAASPPYKKPSTWKSEPYRLLELRAAAAPDGHSGRTGPCDGWDHPDPGRTGCDRSRRPSPPASRTA